MRHLRRTPKPLKLCLESTNEGNLLLHSSLIKISAQCATALTGHTLTILIFHRVLENPDPLFPGEMHARRFDDLLKRLKQSWRVMPLYDSVNMLAAGTLPARSLAITFDDGYADNATVAWPILCKHDCPATIFVSTGYLDGGRMWNDTVIEAVRHTRREALELSWVPEQLRLGNLLDRRRAIDTLINRVKHVPFADRERMCLDVANICDANLPTDLMMTREQLKGLRGNCIDFGAHTMHHPILASLADDEAEREIRQGKSELEAMLGQAVLLFAYPNGKPMVDYLPKHVDMVRSAGFEAAVSTHWGACGQASDRFQLPRFSPWDQDARKFEFRLVKNLFAQPERIPSR